MFGVLGFIPGYLMARLVNAFGLLRVPASVEAAGLDAHDVGDVYPYLPQRDTLFEVAEREAALDAVRAGNGRGETRKETVR
jgi:hypothetical protein